MLLHQMAQSYLSNERLGSKAGLEPVWQQHLLQSWNRAGEGL